MTPDYSLKNIFLTISKWFRKIVIATLLIGGVTALVSLLLPDYYKATTTFYAANPDLFSVPGIGPENSPLYVFGGDAELDRLFSLANSQEVANHLISKFNLYHHYHIDSTGRKAELELMEIFRSQYKTVKTKYDAIELIVEDIDPVMAAEMANEGRNHVEELSRSWITVSQMDVEKTYDKNIVDLNQRGQEVSDSLIRLKARYDIVDARYQLEAMAIAVTKNTDEFNEAKAKVNFYKGTSKRDSLSKYQAMLEATTAIKKYNEEKMKSYNEGVSALRKLEQEYIRTIDQVSLAKERKAQMESIRLTPQKTLFVVDQAVVPKVKSRPKRLIIVLASLVLGFALSIMGALMMESLRKNEHIA